jgi:carboxypeptidase Taq
LERELIDGSVTVRELPEAWNSRMREYLSVTPPTDADGVLQDVHWPSGLFGYFPTYTLGNINSGQIWHAANRALPNLDNQIASGDFAPLLGWLQRNIYQHGKRFLPGELIERATGEALTEKYYLDYVEGKYRELYSL